MAEFTASAAQAVVENQNIVFSTTPVASPRCIAHREGSGIVTLRGLTNCACRARYRVSFGGNIAIPAKGTVGAISVSLAIDGEPLLASTAIITPAAAEQYGNVSLDTYVEVPAGCCATVSVRNTSDQTINVQNANLIVTREA